MTTLTVPLDKLVPISRFGRGTASAEFAKVEDNKPATVLQQPVYFMMFLARIPRPLWSGRNRLLLFNKVL